MAAERGGQEGNEAAVELLTKATEADPTFAVAVYTLGSIHQVLNNRWKATAQYRAAARTIPTYPEPMKALGDLFLAAPRRLFDQAVEAYDKAIQLRPFYADAHVGLGDARAAKGDVQGDVGAYQKALPLQPGQPPGLHESRQDLLRREGALLRGGHRLQEGHRPGSPSRSRRGLGLGEVYEDKGLYKEAIDEYKKVMELDAKHTGALYNLALVYEKVDPKESIVQWEQLHRPRLAASLGEGLGGRGSPAPAQAEGAGQGLDPRAVDELRKGPDGRADGFWSVHRPSPRPRVTVRTVPGRKSLRRARDRRVPGGAPRPRTRPGWTVRVVAGARPLLSHRVGARAGRAWACST